MEHKVYGIRPEDNERADLEAALYINLALKTIKEANDWLKTTKEPAQHLLIHLDILLVLFRRFTGDDRIPLKTPMVKEWEDTFNDWFVRSEKKIPKKYRGGIKESAEKIFAELYTYSNNLLHI